jgi:NAD(P)-dependent dehydrogenase (short-subunit alcohol dehydrogenase family)
VTPSFGTNRQVAVVSETHSCVNMRQFGPTCVMERFPLKERERTTLMRTNEAADIPVVAITGGASGIGEAVARRFADAGWRVVIGDINRARGIAIAEEIGNAVTYLEVDVSSEDAVNRFCAETYSLHPNVDVLVNSAGILQNPVRLVDLDMAEFDRIHSVNVRGTLLTSRSFAAPMIRRGKGSIVNLCSLTSFRPSGQIAYAMGKAALKMLTELMAAELGPKGIRVNAVAPGYTLTPTMQARIEKGERNPKLILEKTALDRFVAPSEVADAILFLCSNAASAITGAILPVDAGWLVASAYLAYASQPK